MARVPEPGGWASRSAQPVPATTTSTAAASASSKRRRRRRRAMLRISLLSWTPPGAGALPGTRTPPGEGAPPREGAPPGEEVLPGEEIPPGEGLLGAGLPEPETSAAVWQAGRRSRPG